MQEATLQEETRKYYAIIYRNSKNLHSMRCGSGVGELLYSWCPKWTVDQVVKMASHSKETGEYDTFSYRVGIVLGYLQAIPLWVLTKEHFEQLKTQV